LDARHGSTELLRPEFLAGVVVMAMPALGCADMVPVLNYLVKIDALRDELLHLLRRYAQGSGTPRGQGPRPPGDPG
jgi:hypothetical protein